MFSVCVKTALVLCYFVSIGLAGCPDPSPAFPLPELSPEDAALKPVFAYIEKELLSIVNSGPFNDTSFSVDITSSEQSLWSMHHTAHRIGDRGVSSVDSNSRYRIASITKVFTVLALLYQDKAGNLSLEDTVDKYLAPLNHSQTGHLPYHDMTLRTLASQLSGLPRDALQEDFINEPSIHEGLGLPPVPHDHLPKCDEYDSFNHPCTAHDLYAQLRTQEPLYAPNQKSSYSNEAFELLGLVLANVTGLPYESAIHSLILTPLNLTQTTFTTPPASSGVIPSVSNFWDVQMGVQNPTGGLYTSPSDLSTFARYILTHYNALTPALNFLNPASFTSAIHSSYGTPWEIFRTEKILPSTRRPVTFITKSGAVPGYYSVLILVPGHDIGISVLVAGDAGFLKRTFDVLTVPLIRAVDGVAMRELNAYAGVYTSSDLNMNTTITIERQGHLGLLLTRFVSNGTDVLGFMRESMGTSRTRFQLSPTLLFQDQTEQRGERWRVVNVEPPQGGVSGVWDDFCVEDVDVGSYAGRPLNELVFWRGEGGDGDAEVREVGLSAWRVVLRKEAVKEEKVDAGSWREWGQQVLRGWR